MGTLSNPKRVLSKAVKFTSKDRSREILTCVHLDERGEVVACDSYRLFTATGWSGPSIDLPDDLARKMAKIPAKYDEVEVERVGDEIVCRYGGNVLKGDVVEGEYPKYHQLFKGWEAKAVSEIPAKQAAVICRAHKRDGVFVEIGDGATVVWGAGCDTEPSAMFRTGCQGEGRVKLNAEYLESALKACGERACVKVMDEKKPVFVKWGGMGVMLMPIMAGTFTEPLIKKLGKREETGMAKQTKKEERMEKVNLSGEVVCITGTLPTMTRNEAFTRLKMVGGTPCERFKKAVTLFVVAAKAGRDKREKAERAIANGQQVRIIDGHEFVEALKAAESEQEARAKELATKKRDEQGGWVVYGETGPCLVAWLSYSTLKTNKGACEWLKRTAKETDGTELATVHAEFVGSTAERDERTDKVKAKLKAYYDKVVTWTPTSGKSGLASTWERAPKGKQEEKKEDANMVDELKKELEQVKAELKSTRKELDKVWKENANLKAKKPEPKEVPPAPKAPKAERHEETAAAVSLESMTKWCEGKGLIASQKRPGTCIWVEGDSKAYKDELVEMGLRFSKKRKSWYYPAA